MLQNRPASRRGAGDALARRIVAHVRTREPENGHNNSKCCVFEFLRQFLKCNCNYFLRKPVRRQRRTCRKGISGEGHGNLEADLAVLTPACGSCSFYRHCPADMKFISVSSSGPRCPPRALRTNSLTCAGARELLASCGNRCGGCS